MFTSLITGGAGFIGSHVAAECLKKGHQVIVLDDLSGGSKDQIPDGALFLLGSTTDYELLNNIFIQYKIDYIYHLAAYAAEGLSHFIRRFNYDNNLMGSINLINLAVIHKVKCFVFTSSIAVYGSNQVPMNENMTPSPEDPYGIAKYATELDLAAARKLFGLNYIIFRPHNVYGENQNLNDKYRNVIAIFFNLLKQGKSLTVFGTGDQTRAFTYIEDVAPYIAQSIYIQKAYNQVFNIGSGEIHSINELINTMGKVLNVKPEICYLDNREEVQHAHSDHSKAEGVFQTSSPISLQEGIYRMFEWAKLSDIKVQKKFGAIEISTNLPAIWI